MKIEDGTYIAAHPRSVGSAIVKKLRPVGLINLIYRNSGDPDLTNQFSVQNNFEEKNLHWLFPRQLSGVIANTTYGADFLYNSRVFPSHAIHPAHNNNVKKLLHFTGSGNMRAGILKRVPDSKIY